MQSPRYGKQCGSMLLTASLFLITLIGTAAVAVDVGHLMVARNELQNAADAAALAGANCLSKAGAGSGTTCTSAPSSSLNWSIASAAARTAIGQNKSDGSALVSGTVTTGYKNLTGSPAGLEPTTLSPVGPNDMPAVMVTLSRSTGSNGGPVQTLITRMFGGAAVPVSVTAVAVLATPSTTIPGTVIPQAINQCMLTQYWNASTNAPQLATASTLNGVPQTIGQPWEIRIGSSYHYPSCNSGQWTSFTQQANDVPTCHQLIINSNPTALSIGTNIWMEPGTKTSLYNDLSAQYPTPPGANVVLPVVNQPAGLTTEQQVPIVGFASFHIDDIQGGSGQYIQGHFIAGMVAPGASGIGRSYGAYSPARLAQ